MCEKINSEQNLDKKSITTINSYRSAASLMLSRMLWDLHPYSWVSRKRIKEWKDKDLGQKAVILCNGPSLNRTNFDELTGSGIFTFGLNKINMLFPRSDFWPSVIVAVNSHVIEQASDFYNTTSIPLFLDSAEKNKLDLIKMCIFFIQQVVAAALQKTVLCQSGKEDPDHFDPNYFAGALKWQLPNIPASTFHYDVAKEVFESRGREIINCTEG